MKQTMRWVFLTELFRNSWRKYCAPWSPISFEEIFRTLSVCVNEKFHRENSQYISKIKHSKIKTKNNTWKAHSIAWFVERQRQQSRFLPYYFVVRNEPLFPCLDLSNSSELISFLSYYYYWRWFVPILDFRIVVTVLL